MDIKAEWNKLEFVSRENNSFHKPYEKELEFYEAVKSGNEEYAREFLEKNPAGKGEGVGVLSENPLRNLQYHFVVIIAIITRSCIEGGMEHEQAYNLSDFYIRKADKCITEIQLSELMMTATLDYTGRMKKLVKKTSQERSCSKPVTIAIDYIYNNLHSYITIEEVAGYVGFSKNYLNRIFKNETGFSIGEYIRLKKLETAENMLKFSDYSYAEIAEYLSFSSQSHFTKAFHKYSGMTPKQYRDKYFRVSTRVLSVPTHILHEEYDKNR